MIHSAIIAEIESDGCSGCCLVRQFIGSVIAVFVVIIAASTYLFYMDRENYDAVV